MKQTRTAKGLAAKGLTALGVLGMLMGALVVFAPTAGASHDGGPSPYGTYGAKGDNANLDCADLDDGTEHGEPSLDFGEQTEIPEDDTAYETRVVEGEPLHIDWTSTSPVGFVLVKQATYTAVFVVDGATSGTVYVDLGVDADASDQALSHVTFCTGEGGGDLVEWLIAHGPSCLGCDPTSDGAQSGIRRRSIGFRAEPAVPKRDTSAYRRNGGAFVAWVWRATRQQ